ncbi:hypothetical protein ACC713_35090 [Rhizobium johnstonii]|uniref:hypothetical protein n=1 Tax=Rhizobium TaxID=379 RepID=UPI0010324277|nr:hypothetical protein [Rhizobium leguminosarum]TBF45662.1 hypothetical protein ELG90_32220 [Rhizobium leguminosarum]TBF86330.1 hypothetical protein ELG85_35675 [Rhizobium leguminosarum]TBG08933.1 hypothetical protein ELG79_36345 [Rhizobium leguminosarum]TBG28566.1 hypothetical protein ELG78_36865 [Rhizobium leguminosarum]TBG52343.1 hypothetical protein ELG74_38015 [Rhizobium leguminosarum]
MRLAFTISSAGEDRETSPDRVPRWHVGCLCDRYFLRFGTNAVSSFTMDRRHPIGVTAEKARHVVKAFGDV